MAEKTEAVIFDMYETLVTQHGGSVYYGTQIANDLGLAPEAFLPEWRKTEADRATGKLTLEETLEQLTEYFGIRSEERLRQVADRRIAFQRQCFHRLHPQILPVLQALKARGLKLGLITNCFSEEAELIRGSSLFPLFDAACLSYELRLRKPDPEIYRRCTEMLEVQPEKCLYVGDGGSHELEAAADFGMRPVQATWYRREDMARYQTALRPEFPQIPEPMQLLKRL